MISDTIGMQLHTQSVDIDELKQDIEALSKKFEYLELSERATLDPNAIKLSIDAAPEATKPAHLEKIMKVNGIMYSQILQLEETSLFPEVYELQQKMRLVWDHLDFTDIAAQS